MWGVTLIYIAVASCNAELYQLKTVHLPTTVDDRVIGGSATTIEQYPFAVQVIYYGRFRCGGSLVTTRHVLSAAHCFVPKHGYHIYASSFFIRAGTTILNSGGSVHLVRAIKAHELYDFMTTSTYDNDVAVVLMATPVDLSTSVARLALIPHQDDTAVIPDNSSVTTIGWGQTDMINPTASTVLNEVTVRKINWKICRARFIKLHDDKFFSVTSNMICAGILDVGGKDSCLGDSGGALLYKGIVVGVTSWGIGCAVPQFPAVYTRVASYTNWINYTINDVLLQNSSTDSLRSKIGAITLLTSFLYLILSV